MELLEGDHQTPSSSSSQLHHYPSFSSPSLPLHHEHYYYYPSASMDINPNPNPNPNQEQELPLHCINEWAGLLSSNQIKNISEAEINDNVMESDHVQGEEGDPINYNNNNNNGGGCEDYKGKMIMEKKKKKRKSRPRFAFHTKSDDNILDDGYRWRKYGQKAVKNSIYPRSYYRCTQHTCNVKKQVQRHSRDKSIVVTTYEGVHNHPCEKLMETLSPLLKQIQFLSHF
ncbi:probable WRKY transcription factor 75 isoform X1 [Dioscorea cayenensis subsp. rotundata]|uniref:Probable WRKY transcription factor 75 isoform X1 n=1 Tax=Dioscorea cayennensis subsp. rotundata TaxID=55577 RepID=A0AB40CXM6_DIOCR|nr:probable WRKY transcription factor 75 isoform X1 [Dioscorea cayenensis subsp. rotundata]